MVFQGVSLRVMKASEVKGVREPNTRLVDADGNGDFVTSEMESDSLTSVPKLFPQGSVMILENQASGSQKGMKRKPSGSEQGIRPKNRKFHVMFLPSNAPARRRM